MMHMKNESLTSQALAFNPVIPLKGEPEGQVVDKEGNTWIQIRADHAQKVSLVIYEEEFPFTKDEGGIWRLKYPRKDGITMVQLMIDGQPVISPYLPIGYGYSRPYNYVTVEEPDGDFYRLKDVPHGTVRQEFFKSSVTGEWERCLVYTPADYDEKPDQKYPVLYLQHGHGENEIGWVSQGRVNLILDNLFANKEAVPFIVVMNNGMVQVEREGQRVVDHTLFPALLMKDVIPFIEKKYRVIGDKEHRAMAGLSMGSIHTSITAFTHPELFDYVGLFSGFLHDFIQGNELMDMIPREKSKDEHLKILDDAEAFRKDFKVFFRAMGKDDIFRQMFLDDDALLKEKGISCIRMTYPGGHEWNVWRRCIRDFSELLFR